MSFICDPGVCMFMRLFCYIFFFLSSTFMIALKMSCWYGFMTLFLKCEGLKCWLALKEFKSSGVDVVLVQVMHFYTGGSLKFVSKYFPTSFITSDPTGKPGVAILIAHCTLTPMEGLSSCSATTSSSFTLVNLYVLNSAQIDFLNESLGATQRYF